MPAGKLIGHSKDMDEFNKTGNLIPGSDRCSHIPEPPPGLLSDLGGPGQPGICWFGGDTAMNGKQVDSQ